MQTQFEFNFNEITFKTYVINLRLETKNAQLSVLIPSLFSNCLLFWHAYILFSKKSEIIANLEFIQLNIVWFPVFYTHIIWCTGERVPLVLIFNMK